MYLRQSCDTYLIIIWPNMINEIQYSMMNSFLFGLQDWIQSYKSL